MTVLVTLLALRLDEKIAASVFGAVGVIVVGMVVLIGVATGAFSRPAPEPAVAADQKWCDSHQRWETRSDYWAHHDTSDFSQYDRLW